MKNFLLLLFFLSIPFIAYSQTPDTATVRIEIDSLIQLNRTLVKERKYEAAHQVIQQAEEKCLAAFGGKTALFGTVVFNKGRTYYRQRDMAHAEQYYIQSKTIREQALGKEHHDYAWSLNNLGALYKDMGNFEKAETFYLEAKAIREKVLGKEHPDYASGLNNLAVLYKNIGQYEKAEPMYLEAKVIREKALGKEHPNYAWSLNNLANLYSDMGKYEKAELLYLEAKVIREKTLGEEHPDYAWSLNSLANLYWYMGQYEKAEPMYVESIAIHEKVLGKEHPDYASSLNNLAGLYINIGQSEKAEPLYVEAKAIREKALGKEHPNYASSLNNLAVLYVDLGQSEKAEPLYVEAKAIREKALGKEHPDYALSLNNLAILYKILGQYEKAEPLFVEAKAIHEKAQGKKHPDYAECINKLATLYCDMGQYEKAEPLMVEANEIEKTLLKKASRHLSERELLIYTNKFIDKQNKFLSFAQTQSALSEAAYDNTLFHKGFLLNATQKVNRLAQTDSMSTELFLHLKGINRRLATIYSQPLTERDSSTVADLEEKTNTLEKELTRSVAGLGEALRQVSWQEVQSALQSGAAAVEFVHYNFSNPELTDSTMYAAIVLENSGPPKFIPLFEEKTLDSLLSIHQERRADYVNDLYSIADRGAVALSKPKKTLYEIIWQPIEKELEGITTIYYAPSGLLHRINLNAIPIPIAIGTIGIDDEKTISDRYKTVQLNSTRSLVVNNAASARNKEAVLYGGIQFDQDSTAIANANADYPDESLTSRGAFNFISIDTTLRGGIWNYLKWTKTEVESIHSILEENKMEPSIYSDYLATEESFRAIGQKDTSPRILHIATHGFFFPDPEDKPVENDKEPVFKSSDNPMIRSGLILAGGNHVWQGNAPLGNMEDGILTAYEISQMDLSNTELVVLSACETGLGDIQGNEGVYGLQRAFKIAGAKYLIMSLWQVPDRPTKDFMVAFYKHWLQDEMTIPDAFRKTQQEIKERFYDPYNWAGFVLVE